MDMKAYTETKEIMGEVFYDLIATFLEFMPAQVEELERAIQQKDTEQIFAIAHRIKSSSSSIGANGMAAQAQQIELKGRDGETDGTAELFEELVNKYTRVSQFLRSELP